MIKGDFINLGIKGICNLTICKPFMLFSFITTIVYINIKSIKKWEKIVLEGKKREECTTIDEINMVLIDYMVA